MPAEALRNRNHNVRPAGRGEAGPVWANCTVNPPASSVSSGVLVPQSNDDVICSGTSNISLDNDAANGVTVDNTGSLTPAATLPPINLNAGSNIINAEVITGQDVSGNLGAVTIQVTGDTNGPGRGVAVSLSGGGRLTLENTGTIDASRAARAISASGGATTVINAGTLRGGTGGAINLGNSDGSQVVLRQGSVIDGQVSVRSFETVAQTPVSVLPTRATLGLEGTGTEDDKLTGFNFIEKRGAGAWTLGTDLQAGSATDGYQSGDFRGSVNIVVDGAGGLLDLVGAISDNPDGTKASFAKSGPGTLRLSGTSPSAGGFLVGGGTLDIEIKPDGSGNDLLAVGGSASLAGALTRNR